MNEISCEHPQIIINPQLARFALSNPVYYFGGVRNVFRLPKSVQSRAYDYTALITHVKRNLYNLFSPKKIGIKKENIETCYFVNQDTGEALPIYILVPCGHCDICQEKKRQALSVRCDLETSAWQQPPIFVTLTYDEKHNPKEVKVKDVQNYFKRLRRYINYHHGNVDISNLRYMAVSEYTPTCTRRPHYHILVWNFPWQLFDKEPLVIHREGFDVFMLPNTARTMFYHAWQQQGYVTCELACNNGASYYLGKYIGKNNNVPIVEKYFVQDSEKPIHHAQIRLHRNFRLSSKKHGGIGSPYIDKHIQEYRANPTKTDWQYLDVCSNKINQLFPCKYFIDRVFPTFSRQVSKELRDLYDNVTYRFPLLVSHKLLYPQQIYWFKRVIKRFPACLYYNKTYTTYQDDEILDYQIHLGQFLSDLLRLDVLTKGCNYFEEMILQNKRTEFLTAMSATPIVSLSTRVYRLKRRLAQEKERIYAC